MLEQVIKETHKTFVDCFHIFYPTPQLKWTILCDLLDRVQKVTQLLSLFFSVNLMLCQIRNYFYLPRRFRMAKEIVIDCWLQWWTHYAIFGRGYDWLCPICMICRRHFNLAKLIHRLIWRNFLLSLALLSMIRQSWRRWTRASRIQYSSSTW